MPASAVAGSLSAVGALDEPTRRRLYLFVRAAGHPVTRDEGSAHAGISRKLAAFHLDRLVDAGLLVPGPGPRSHERRRGRAPKTYEPSGLELDVSIPPRHSPPVAAAAAPPPPPPLRPRRRAAGHGDPIVSRRRAARRRRPPRRVRTRPPDRQCGSSHRARDAASCESRAGDAHRAGLRTGSRG